METEIGDTTSLRNILSPLSVLDSPLLANISQETIIQDDLPFGETQATDMLSPDLDKSFDLLET